LGRRDQSSAGAATDRHVAAGRSGAGAAGVLVEAAKQALLRRGIASARHLTGASCNHGGATANGGRAATNRGRAAMRKERPQPMDRCGTTTGGDISPTGGGWATTGNHHGATATSGMVTKSRSGVARTQSHQQHDCVHQSSSEKTRPTRSYNQRPYPPSCTPSGDRWGKRAQLIWINWVVWHIQINGKFFGKAGQRGSLKDVKIVGGMCRFRRLGRLFGLWTGGATLVKLGQVSC
jgi:hypothetical protein